MKLVDIELDSSPVLVSIPHSGQVFPKFVDFWTDKEKFVDTDIYTDQLVLSWNRVIARLSPQWVNVNRPWKPWKRGPRSVTRDPFTHLYNGKDIRARLTKKERTLATLAYKTYHASIDQILKFLVREYGMAFLIDLHAYNTLAPKGLPGQGVRPEVCVSGRPDLARALAERLEFESSVNYPYRGGYILRRYSRRKRVYAVQLEVRKDLYTRGFRFDKKKAERVRERLEKGIKEWVRSLGFALQ